MLDGTDPTEITLKELCDDSGISERTVRYYMANGIIPPAPRSGPGVRYPRTHLTRLKLIRRWQEEGLPLDQIRKLLADLTDVEVERLHAKDAKDAAPAPPRSSAADYVKKVLGRAARPAPSPASPPPSSAPPSPQPPEPDDAIARAHWERFAIDDDVEIHVRRPLSHLKNRRVEALVREARRIMKETP